MEESLKIAIEQMKHGEEQGFNEVYSRSYNRVYFRAKQIMKNEEDAQDLVQIVFIEAYQSISSLQCPEALYGWLDGITYRQGMKIFRKKKEPLLTEEASGVFDTLESNDITAMPELTADQKATSEIVMGIIEELSELQKTAVVSYYFDNLKVEEIADMMECSVNTIKSRLNYARKYIKGRVEEKEKKEGYRLHVIGVPVLWFAIRMLSEKTTLSTQTAQGIYNTSCMKVGLQATAIHVKEGSAGIAEPKAGTGAKVKKTTGFGAKMASLSTTAKVLMIAGAVVVVGGISSIAYLSAKNEEQMVTQEQAGSKQEEKEDAESTNEESETKEIHLSEEAQRQISAFVAAAYQCNYAQVNGGQGWKIFKMSPEECLFFIKDYVDMVKSEAIVTDVSPNPADLPYDWYSGNITTQEIAEFFEDGLGIHIKEDFSYSVQAEEGNLSFADGKMKNTFDDRMLQVTGGNVEVVSQDKDKVVLSGNCAWYDPEKTEYDFTVTAKLSGNNKVFGGLTITDIQVEEKISETTEKVNYDLMAEQCSKMAQGLVAKYGIAVDGSYFIADVNKDGVPEFIIQEGNSEADYRYVIYGFDGSNTTEIGSFSGGHISNIYGTQDKCLYTQVSQMGYEIFFVYDVQTNTESKVYEGEMDMDANGDFVSQYTLPDGAYKLTKYTNYDKESIYQVLTTYQ